MPSAVQSLMVGNASLAWTRVGPRSPNPLLFLHGLGDSSIMTFERIARHPELADRPAVLVDLPGFGYGEAPDDWPGRMEDHAAAVFALIDALELRGVTLVGHSMGGSLALLVARHRQDRVSRLVLSEPLLDRDHSELGKAIARRPEEAFVERGFKMLLLATRRQASRGQKAAQGFYEPLQRAHPAILHRSAVSLLQNREPTFLDLLGDLTMPRVLLIGERTEVDLGIVPDDVRVMVVPDAGHSMMSENPDAFARAVAAGSQPHSPMRPAHLE